MYRNLLKFGTYPYIASGAPAPFSTVKPTRTVARSGTYPPLHEESIANHANLEICTELACRRLGWVRGGSGLLTIL